jgi:hypothetical protein
VTATARRPAAGPRILLVDDLDAAGAALADTRMRAEALRQAGAHVRALALGGAWTGPTEAPAGAVAVTHCPHPREGWPLAASWLRDDRIDLMVLASAARGGDRAWPRGPRSVSTMWWPTGFAGASNWSARLATLGLRRTGRGAMPGPSGDALLWCALGDGAARKPLPLWDGEFVLAPGGLAGADAAIVMDAFARLDHEALDLVVLAHPDPRLERLARRAGVASRVHSVGPATRDAEWAWWRQAAAAVWAGGAPVSGGLLLRGLAAECPQLVLDRALPGGAIGGWLAGHDSACRVARDAPDLAHGISAALRREPAIRHAIGQGRALATRHDSAGLARRLVGCLEGMGRDVPHERAA